MSTTIVWFRSDLRLHDHPVLRAACTGDARHLLPVVCLPDVEQRTGWGFPRWGRHRRAWWASTIDSLRQDLAALGCPLLICAEPGPTALPRLARAVGAQTILCETIAAPDEQDEVNALRVAGLTVDTIWHSSLLVPDQLPWPVARLPRDFTAFRHGVERAGIQPAAPPARPAALPPWPLNVPDALRERQDDALSAFAGVAPAPDARSAFACLTHPWQGGEHAALAHLAQYLDRGLPTTYKEARNGLMGQDFSSKWSPWLATGALSPRLVMARLRDFETAHGVSEGSYWLWFELLWRDYFRFLHLQHGRALYRAHGLAKPRDIPHDADRFDAWRAGQTGEPLVDAAMRELAATGYLSNRLRQVVAAFLVHDLACDWRAGAAWFESQLLDYDVYNNQGNWLYIAGLGTDPRGGRRFHPAYQAQMHDPDGTYRRRWLSS